MLDGRDAREDAIVAAALIASRTSCATIAFARSFTIDPLFAWLPDPQLSNTRDYPTWTWQIPPREGRAEIVKAVRDADETLQKHGYCGPDDRCAYFLTTLCFAPPEGDPRIIEEWCDGQFYLGAGAESERGINFARCLIPTGYREPLDQLDSQVRKELSDFRRSVQAFESSWRR